MIQAFDRIILAVPDLDEAIGQYRVLFGVEPKPIGDGRAWLGLPNTVLELTQDTAPSALVQGLVFSDLDKGEILESVDNPLGLSLATCNGSATAQFRECFAQAQCPDLRVDHLVLRTTDAAACIALFCQHLGIRLALDKTVPQWGGRMLFFRAGKLTLEVIESSADEAGGNVFWGLAFQCQNIEHEARRLRRAGVELSEIRPGRKPYTQVATVKSHHLGIPSLLIEPSP